MEQTALNKAIESIGKQIEYYSNRKYCYTQEEVDSYVNSEIVLIAVKNTLQSLLPVEQEQMDKARIDVLNWLRDSGYTPIQELERNDRWMNNMGECLSPTELLQLFNQQNK